MSIETKQSWEQCLADVALFFGDVNQVEARIYAALPTEIVSSDVTLSGTLSGPHSEFAHTLITQAPLRQRKQGSPVLAEAILPDPCSWTPDLPFVYDVDLELRAGGEVVAQQRRTLGLRTLGTRKNHLFFDGKRWVARGVDRAIAPVAKLKTWREESAALLAVDPSEALLSEATGQGVVLFAELSATGAQLTAQLSQIARHAACGAALLLPEQVDAQLLKQRPRNLLLAARLGASGSAEVPAWAELVVAEGADVDEIAQLLAGVAIPSMAVQTRTDLTDVAGARRECDRLQAALAGRAVCAGYFVRALATTHS